MSSAAVAIETRGLRKSFRVAAAAPADRPWFRPRLRAPDRELVVLDGVSFTVRRGETFGVVGRNGSGKSTLMRLLAGIYEPDGGELYVTDGSASFIDLGAGFNGQLSVRENVLLKGILLGLPRDLIKRRSDAVLDFAELHDFADVEFKRLSSGMKSRLAFGVMLEADPEILLLDEILSVGDLGFRAKCTEVFDRYHARGKTIVLVSHSTGAIAHHCSRAIFLEDGAIEHEGDAGEVVRRYSEKALGRRGTEGGSLVNVGSEDGRVRARFTDLEVSGTSGGRLVSSTDSHLEVAARLSVERPIGGPSLRVELRHQSGTLLFAPPPIPLSGGGEKKLRRGTHQLRLSIENRLVPGAYELSCELTRTTPAGRNAPVSAVASTTFSTAGRPNEDDGLVRLACNVLLEESAAREVLAR